MTQEDVYDWVMSPRSEIDPEDSDLLYEQLAEILRGQIESGELAPRRPVPSREQLGQRYGVSRPTVASAIQILVREGLVKRVRGKTFYVTDPEERNR